MMCFYSRRRQNLKRWCHMEQMLTQRSLQQKLESRLFGHKSFVPSNDKHYRYDEKRRFDSWMPLHMYHVTHDHFNQNQNAVTNKFTSSTQTAANVSDETSLISH